MRITKYSHFFTVSNVSGNSERDAVRSHCYPLLLRESFRKPNGDIVYGETKKFYSFNKEKTECRFHINDFHNFCEHLRVRGINLNHVEIIEAPSYTPPMVEFEMNSFYVPRDDQPTIIQYFLDPYPSIKMCELETGGGKELHVDEPVLTKDGWVRIGDIKIGDIVRCPDNSLTRVTGVFPQGRKPLYRVKLKDGRSVLAGLNHLWKVFVGATGLWEIKNTAELIDFLENSKEALLELPTIDVAINAGVFDNRIKSIEFELVDEAICISVNHPDSLYITRDYIVTHNTFTSVYSLAQMKLRGFLSIRPQYFKNWIKAFFGEGDKQPLVRFGTERLLIIQGSIQLKDAIKHALNDDFDYDFVMISNSTLYIMNKIYDEMGSTVDAYGCEPWELYQVFGVGCLLKDEGHMDFHANYRLDLFVHVPLSITLSGTFSSDNVFIKKMQQLQHPINSRAPSVAPNKFRAVKAIRYSIDSKRPLKYKLRGRTEYNHTELENSILKDKRARRSYLELIQSTFEKEYLYVRENKEQKVLILCGLIEMAEVIIQHLSDTYPELDISRYVGGDDFIAACGSEVIVTTVMSGKAAIDIPNLIVAINTVNVGSKETNLQALGRLRELKHYPNIRPTFVYLYTDDIPSPSFYHQNKLKLFASRVFSHVSIDSNITL